MTDKDHVTDLPRCSKCGRLDHVCDKGKQIAGDESTGCYFENRVCDALARVRSLSRFRSNVSHAPPFLRVWPKLVDDDGHATYSMLSIHTLALLREWRRLRNDQSISMSSRVELADVVAQDLAERLALDLSTVDLNATIGDLCPECGEAKIGGGDEGLGSAYWCDECRAAAKREVEHG